MCVQITPTSAAAQRRNCLIVRASLPMRDRYTRATHASNRIPQTLGSRAHAQTWASIYRQTHARTALKKKPTHALTHTPSERDPNHTELIRNSYKFKSSNTFRCVQHNIIGSEESKRMRDHKACLPPPALRSELMSSEF